jgi:hypothetical protein
MQSPCPLARAKAKVGVHTEPLKEGEKQIEQCDLFEYLRKAIGACPFAGKRHHKSGCDWR